MSAHRIYGAIYAHGSIGRFKGSNGGPFEIAVRMLARGVCAGRDWWGE